MFDCSSPLLIVVNSGYWLDSLFVTRPYPAVDRKSVLKNRPFNPCSGRMHDLYIDIVLDVFAFFVDFHLEQTIRL